MTIKIRRLSYALGAEVLGVDPSRAQDAATVAAIRAAWLEHLVLVFPGMDMTVAQHVEFSRQFGELEAHPVAGLRDEDHPEMFRVTNRITNGKRSETAEAGRVWHSDGAYTLRPPTGALLHCRARPDVGGDTWFTNMYRAYDTLSDTLKGIVDKLSVVNDLGAIPATKRRDPLKLAQALQENPPVVQPMVRVHPETGRKALYLSEAVTRRIDGMTEEESRGLLQYLFAHSVRPEFTFRHTWRLHDLVLWDNRCAMHLAPPDFDPAQLREMFRTTLVGETMGRALAR